MYTYGMYTSDESEPSWLEPQLELKDFQLGSTRDLFDLSSELKLTKNEPKFQFSIEDPFFIVFFYKVVLKMIKLCTFYAM